MTNNDEIITTQDAQAALDHELRKSEVEKTGNGGNKWQDAAKRVEEEDDAFLKKIEEATGVKDGQFGKPYVPEGQAGYSVTDVHDRIFGGKPEPEEDQVPTAEDFITNNKELLAACEQEQALLIQQRSQSLEDYERNTREAIARNNRKLDDLKREYEKGIIAVNNELEADLHQVRQKYGEDQISLERRIVECGRKMQGAQGAILGFQGMLGGVENRLFTEVIDQLNTALDAEPVEPSAGNEPIGTTDLAEMPDKVINGEIEKENPSGEQND